MVRVRAAGVTRVKLQRGAVRVASVGEVDALVGAAPPEGVSERANPLLVRATRAGPDLELGAECVDPASHVDALKSTVSRKQRG